MAGSCIHHFSWVTQSGLRCDVCGKAISAQMVSEDRGKVCQKCGLAVHVNCQHQLP